MHSNLIAILFCTVILKRHVLNDVDNDFTTSPHVNLTILKILKIEKRKEIDFRKNKADRSVSWSIYRTDNKVD